MKVNFEKWVYNIKDYSGRKIIMNIDLEIVKTDKMIRKVRQTRARIKLAMGKMVTSTPTPHQAACVAIFLAT